MFKEIELSKLKPNPWRDFKVDPENKKHIDELVESIKEHDFWGGIVVCEREGNLYSAAGWHRTRAAIKAGIKKAPLAVVDLDDAMMIRVYARENALQRNSGISQAGSIASAIWHLALVALSPQDGVAEPTAMSRDIPRHAGRESHTHGDKKAIDIIRGQIMSEKGIGVPIISDFLGKIPGLSPNAIEDHLANLKASGDYVRIIDKVKAEIEERHKSTIKTANEIEREIKDAGKDNVGENELPVELKRKLANNPGAKSVIAARKSSRKAHETYPAKFNLAGISKHIQGQNRLNVMRSFLSDKEMPFDKQEELAEQIANKFRELGKENYSSESLRDELSRIWDEENKSRTRSDKETTRQRERTDLLLRHDNLMEELERTSSQWVSVVQHIIAFQKDNPGEYRIPHRMLLLWRGLVMLVNKLDKFIDPPKQQSNGSHPRIEAR